MHDLGRSNYRLPRLSKMTPRRIARGVRRYATMPFQSRFDRRVSAVVRTGEEGKHDLDVIRGFPEMNDPLKGSAWFGLERIGVELVRRFRPKVVVELGTHMGFSALAMGLQLKANGDNARLYAVDTWEGEEHAGRYDESVYRTFLKRRSELELEATVVPLRMRFDEACPQIPTPIDLLHIDGLHTWEAVATDFATFGPLVRPGGLVLFHDVCSSWVDVRRFWDTLRPHYRTHTISHSNGLGILEMPRQPSLYPNPQKPAV